MAPQSPNSTNSAATQGAPSPLLCCKMLRVRTAVPLQSSASHPSHALQDPYKQLLDAALLTTYLAPTVPSTSATMTATASNTNTMGNGALRYTRGPRETAGTGAWGNPCGTACGAAKGDGKDDGIADGIAEGIAEA